MKINLNRTFADIKATFRNIFFQTKIPENNKKWNQKLAFAMQIQY